MSARRRGSGRAPTGCPSASSASATAPIRSAGRGRGGEDGRERQAVDARVNNSEGASVNTNLSQFVYANSHGFCHGQQGSRHSLSTTLIAQQEARQ